MAAPELVKRYLTEIEADRVAGRPSIAPSWLQPGNILGGKSDAFAQAVKQQGLMLLKLKYPLLGDLPLSSTGGQMPTAPPDAPPPVGGIWADVEAEQARRAQNGGLRAPVLEALGLIKRGK